MELTPSSPQFVYDIESRRYINIGKHCTLQCTFCPKHNGHYTVHDFDLALKTLPTAKQLINALGDLSHVEEIVFCGYSEPTLRMPVLVEVAKHIKPFNVPVRVNTDGLGNLVNKRNILSELAPWVDSLSISMNAQCESVYNQHCNPGIPQSYLHMMNFLKWAPYYIKQVTATAIEGLPDVDTQACAHMAHQLGTQFRTRYLDQVG